jgi:hypothetical protein
MQVGGNKHEHCFHALEEDAPKVSRAWLHLKVACCAGYRAVDTMVWGD